MYSQVTSLLEKSPNHAPTYVTSTQISYLTFAHVVCRPPSHTQNSHIYLEFAHDQQSEQILIHTSVWNRCSFMLVCRTDICSASRCEQIFIHASAVNRYSFVLVCETDICSASGCKQIFILASVVNRYSFTLVCRTDICSASECEQIFIHVSTVNRYSFMLAVHTLEIPSLLDFCPTASSSFDPHKSLDKVYTSYTVHCKQGSHRVLFSMSLNKTVSAALMTWVERFSSDSESLLVHCFTWHTELSAY